MLDGLAPGRNRGEAASGSGRQSGAGERQEAVAPNGRVEAPSVNLPKGGGAIRGLGEKFAVSPATGTATLAVPIPLSPARSSLTPQLTLSYDSGAGNGAFGFGWTISLPSITRKTSKGIPQYQDGEESDVFLLSGLEDLVPELVEEEGQWFPHCAEREVDGRRYAVRRYRPRVESQFARIERWTDLRTGEIHWRSISRDNLTNLYGATANSRIADPEDPLHVFSWLLCESYDERGNCVRYEYKPEDSEGVHSTQAHERNRTPASRSANRYPKRIRYGNRVPREMLSDPSQADWMFEAVFDYGEHDPHCPTPHEAGPWLCRHDPFSSYRSGFEVRTYRLGQRVLMFHHFPEEEGVGRDCLVRATTLTYRNRRDNPVDLRQGDPVAAFIASIRYSGYRRQGTGGYLERSLPPLELGYTEATVHEEIRDVEAAGHAPLAHGLGAGGYQWVDLDGEGLSGILSEQAHTWFYEPNLGGGRFGPVEPVRVQPSLAALNTGRQQLLDLAGDGQLDLVILGGFTPGFYERTPDREWESFRTFPRLPHLSWQDPNLRLLDLNGDGHADLLLTEDHVFTWYPSLAEEGFGAARYVSPSLDEEEGPRLVFAEADQSVYLADMSGDGLTDLVRIRNGEVCYWPNLGYGRFGARVTMDDSPWFDAPDRFDQRRLRLADIDGSGATDLIYLGADAVFLYSNQSGNRWSAPHPLRHFPRIDNLSSVEAVDLLGNGTACLVWSSPLPGDAQRPLRYIDLMGGQKPYLLNSIQNNLGAETRVQYAASTRFYLEDKEAGTSWITRLPFPVQVVERVETYDRISHNRFVTRSTYHHGFYDGIEREFRGFGRVDQWDTEEFGALSAGGMFPAGANDAPTYHVPPVLTRTWFHTGACVEESCVSRHFAEEYDCPSEEEGTDAGYTGRRPASLLEDTALPSGLSPKEAREACRALRGAILRQEVYAQDGTEATDRPYSVSERNFTLQFIQPQGPNRHAVFSSYPRETVDLQYERKLYPVGHRRLADPRVTHTMTLAIDAFGNALEAVSISYGRRHPEVEPQLSPEDRREQRRTRISYTKNRYTHPLLEEDAYRTPQPCETRTYELLKAAARCGEPRGKLLFRFEEMLELVRETSDGCHDLPFEDWEATGAAAGRPYRRLTGATRTLYRNGDLTGPLPLGQIGRRALAYENYRLALTPGLVAGVYGDRLTDTMLENAGGYVRVTDDPGWWVPSGRIFYSPGRSDTPQEELAYARRHFFLPHRFRDPFGHTVTVSYDAYDLLIQETVDALNNRVTVGERDPKGTLVSSGNDYRVIQPARIMDANRNRSAVAFDALGLVVAKAVMGKPEEQLGDSLAGVVEDLSEAEIAAHLEDPTAAPWTILRSAGTRLVYDLFAYQRTQNEPQPQPPVVYTFARETHAAELEPGQKSRVVHAFTYSDGFGREIQKKVLGAPGPLAEGEPSVSPRWVGSGWTISNNKGQPVRQYEPFFSATHHFEFARSVGVSILRFYDPLGRVVATLRPDHTYEKILFDPWRQTSWNVSDTILQDDPRRDPDVGAFFRPLPESEYLPGWYEQRRDGALGPEEKATAAKAAVHANTPAVAHLDVLNHTILTVSHNRFKDGNAPRDEAPTEEFYRTRTHFDLEGNPREVRDDQDRLVVRQEYDLLGNRIHQASMEAGERWSFTDVAGNPCATWDSRNQRRRTAYDPLRRPVELYLQEGSGPELLVGRTVFGETLPDPEPRNQRGKVVQLFDQAGVLVSVAYDFKGNLLHSRRSFAQEYRTTLNWSQAVALEEATYASHTRYDALNRPIELTAPDGSITRPTYDEASQLTRMEVRLRGCEVFTPFVTRMEYDARGGRSQIEYGNGVRTTYRYDPRTLRLVHLQTRRNPALYPEDCPEPSPQGWPGCAVQNLHYTYYPAGDLAHLRNDAQQTIYFRNGRVEPSSDYTYDALSRLIEARGREHLGLVGGQRNAPIPPDGFPISQDHPGDGGAMGRYVERYRYDAVGNLLTLRHRGSDPAHPGWTREYAYNEPSQLEPEKSSNRLSSSTLGNGIEEYQYEGPAGLHGNLTAMPHLPRMQWDYRDQLQATARQVVNDGGTPETTWYVYDSSGQRVRKVTERQAGAGQAPTRKEERIYLGGWETYREYSGDGSTVTLERETLHVMDDLQRIALVETRTLGEDPSPAQLIRYQLSTHLGSSSIELDAEARIISYEEYYPYGGTSFQAVRSQTETTKRYRYSGKERDSENGFSYHGARYYAPWLGRWISCDPGGTQDSLSLYVYCKDNPTTKVDQTGGDTEWCLFCNPFSDDVEFAPLEFTGKVVVGIGKAAYHTGKDTVTRVVDLSTMGFAAYVKTISLGYVQLPYTEWSPEAKKYDPEKTLAENQRSNLYDNTVGGVVQMGKGIAHGDPDAIGGAIFAIAVTRGSSGGPPGSFNVPVPVFVETVTTTGVRSTALGLKNVAVSTSSLSKFGGGGISLMTAGASSNNSKNDKSSSSSGQSSSGSGKSSSSGDPSDVYPRPVDPLGDPFTDPAPPNYKQGHPSRPVVDHILNRAREGHPTDPANLDIKTWEANSRKAGFEGNYTRDLQRYMQQGLTEAQARYVLQGEARYILRDVHARPVDPFALDTLADNQLVCRPGEPIDWSQ